MHLRRFLHFVWRSVGPQGALLYTALLLVRRVESARPPAPLLHQSLDFMARFAVDNGPNVTRLKNASCAPFFPLSSHHRLFNVSVLLAPAGLQRHFANATATAELLISVWTRLRSPPLCKLLLQHTPRLAVCRLVTSDKQRRCSVQLAVAGEEAVTSGECSEQERRLVKAKNATLGWGREPIFYCDARERSVARQWLVFLDIRLRDSGVVRLMFPLQDVHINQCETEDRCPDIKAQCEYRPIPGAPPFSLGNYVCRCAGRKLFNGSDIEAAIRNGSYPPSAAAADNSDQPGFLDEVPFTCGDLCPQVCAGASCAPVGACPASINYRFMRDFPLGVQSFCITVCLVIMGIVFKIRRKRVIKTSGWALLEIFIFGAVLLYATVVVMYFEPSRDSCLLLPWLREVGFSITYGTLIVKVYRVLSGFQSRKAHRVCVRDKDVLRYILGIFVAVVAYMGAWTAVNVDHLKSNNVSSIVEMGVTPDGRSFKVCRAGIWCGVAEASELLFLCWGLYYCHCVRSAPSEYSELRFITVSLIFETVVSLVLHIAHHFLWNRLHPDYVYIMYFVRCHLTVTIAVILIIGPKLWYLHRPPSTQFGRTPALSHADSHLVQPIKLNLTSNGEIDLGEINIADMDPEDIRRELKRLYTQMEIYKTKEMRKDNPHVSKRRGGRKQTHRRFSLQPFHHKHRSHQTSASVHEEEVSKVSDASNNSGDEAATSAERKTTS